MKFLILCLILTACVTEKVYERNSLYNQILRVRKDYPNKLTNNICLEYKKNVCIRNEVQAYDMQDEKFRDKLISFNFHCQIAGKRFRICRDRPGYCRWEDECAKHNFLGTFGCKEYKETYIPSSEHQLLLDSNTICSKQ